MFPVTVTATRSISLMYNLVRGLIDWNKLDEILDGLYVSMLPVKHSPIGSVLSHTHLDIIERIKQQNPKRPLGLVVSVVEKDELHGEGFLGFATVLPEDWERAGVEHRLLEMRDFQAEVDTHQAIETVFYMKKVYDQGKSVVVHCKAGRARSAMLCLLFMALFSVDSETGQLYSLDNALKLLQNKRKQVHVGNDKVQTAHNLLFIATTVWDAVGYKLPLSMMSIVFGYLAPSDVDSQIL